MISLQLKRTVGVCSLLSSIFSHLYSVPAHSAVHVFARSPYYSYDNENMFDWLFDQDELKNPTEIWNFACPLEEVVGGLNVTFESSIPIINVVGHNSGTYPANTHLWRDPDRLEKLRTIAKEYFKPKASHIELAQKLLGNGKRLGIHFRGTDKRHEVPRVEPEQVFELFRQLPEHDSVFLATDEASAASFFQQKIPSLFMNDHLRCDGEQGVHALLGDRRQATETMVDVYCLGMCDTLLIGRGNCGDMALVFGTPKIVEYYN